MTIYGVSVNNLVGFCAMGDNNSMMSSRGLQQQCLDASTIVHAYHISSNGYLLAP